MKLVAMLGLVMTIGAADAIGEDGGSVSEHALIIRFDYGNADWSPFLKFEESLEAAVEESGLGEYEGNELAVDGSDGTLYMYGSDADALFRLVRPYLEKSSLMRNVTVTLRYGAVDDPTARETVIRIGA